MSVKKEYEVKTHTVTEKVCVKETIHCDVCNGIIDDHKKYWELTTGHHDWGNDSCESIEHFDICSEVCLREKFDEYIRDCLKRMGGDNSMYFKVERV